MNRLLSTSLIAASAYGLSLLASQPLAFADSPARIAPAASSTELSVATQSLGTGDDIQARFVLSLQADQPTQAAVLAALSPATAMLADGDDVQARFILDLQH